MKNILKLNPYLEHGQIFANGFEDLIKRITTIVKQKDNWVDGSSNLKRKDIAEFVSEYMSEREVCKVLNTKLGDEKHSHKPTYQEIIIRIHQKLNASRGFEEILFHEERSEASKFLIQDILRDYSIDIPKMAAGKTNTEENRINWIINSENYSLNKGLLLLILSMVQESRNKFVKMSVMKKIGSCALDSLPYIMSEDIKRRHPPFKEIIEGAYLGYHHKSNEETDKVCNSIAFSLYYSIISIFRTTRFINSVN